MRIGWVLVWVHSPTIRRILPGLWQFLPGTGFRFDYRADGVSVYRRVSGVGRASRPGWAGPVSSGLGGGVLEQAFGGQAADQAAQPSGQPGALLGRQARQDPRLT